VPGNVLSQPALLAGVLGSYHLEDVEDLYASIGTGTRLAPLVARHFLPEPSESTPEVQVEESGTLAVEGTEGLILSYAKCCRPIPGDDIVGVVSASRGLVIHRLECEHVRQNRPMAKNSKNAKSDRVELVWSPKVQGDFEVTIAVNALNQRGLLARVAGEIAAAGSSIENVKMPEGVMAGEAFDTEYLITVSNRVQLAQVIKRVRRIASVQKVERLG